MGNLCSSGLVSSSACLLIPLILKTCLRVSQSLLGLTLVWIPLHPRHVSYAVCGLLSPDTFMASGSGMWLHSALLLSSPCAILRQTLAATCWRPSELALAKHPRRALQHHPRNSGQQCNTSSAHCCQPMRLVFRAVVPRIWPITRFRRTSGNKFCLASA
jgi:hypothetical protein